MSVNVPTVVSGARLERPVFEDVLAAATAQGQDDAVHPAASVARHSRQQPTTDRGVQTDNRQITVHRPLRESEPQELQQAKPKSQSQEERHPPRLQNGEQRRQLIQTLLSAKQQERQQSMKGQQLQEEEQRPPPPPRHQQEEELPKLEEAVQLQQQRRVQHEEGQETSSSEPLPAESPSPQDRQQPQKKDEERHELPKPPPQATEEHQPLGDEPSATELPSQQVQRQQQPQQPNKQPREDQEKPEPQELRKDQEQPELQEPQEHQEQPEPQEPRVEEEDETPLPSNLPSLRWGESAQLSKCCPPEEALVRRPGGGPPSCESVAPEQRWRPLLLNGRSGQRVPPDARSALISGNVSCPDRHFWLDSTAGDGFELLTTGHLYLRRSDALMEPLSFCADRLVVYLGEGDDAGVPQVQVGDAARVCTVSLHEPSSVLDEETLTPTCARHTCLRKCCPRGLKLRLDDQLCVPQTGARPWEPEFWLDDIPVPDFRIVAGNPSCKAADGTFRKVFPLEPAYYDEDAFFLREDGRLWVPHQDIAVDLEDFCVDQVRDGHVKVIAMSGNATLIVIVRMEEFCIDEAGFSNSYNDIAHRVLVTLPSG